MDPQSVFFPHPDCPARGQPRQGHIGVHKAKKLFVGIIAWLAYGCPSQAVVAVFGLDPRMVQAWPKRAGGAEPQGASASSSHGLMGSYHSIQVVA